VLKTILNNTSLLSVIVSDQV